MTLSPVRRRGRLSVAARWLSDRGTFFAYSGTDPERIIESGQLSAERLNEALDLLKPPGIRAFGGGTVAVWGQRQS